MKSCPPSPGRSTVATYNLAAMIPSDPASARPPLPPPPSARRPRSGGGNRLLAILFVSVALLGALAALGATYGAVRAAASYQQFARDLPSVTLVGTRPVFKTTRILDRNGKLIYEL